MLSEGWDAKNVTHIMGLRAFTSQLLCEQVIGRGLRRVSYETDENGLFLPEYVNIFGVPLSIYQHVGEGGEAPPPPKASTQIEALDELQPFEIRWPNVLRVDTVVRPELKVDFSQVDLLRLDPAQTTVSAEIAPALGGAAFFSQAVEINLEKIPDGFRLQRILFRAAAKAFDEIQHQFSGNREYLLFQLVRLVEQYLESDRIDIPSLYHQDPLRKRILYSLNMDVIVQRLLEKVREQNVEHLELVFDEDAPIGSTRQMRTWFTTKKCLPTRKSQITYLLADSSWEVYAANILEKSKEVLAYAKNDRLGYQIYYMWQGARRRFIPDFLIRLSNDKTLVLEIKGVDSEQNRAKRAALDEWVRAVNQKGGFGQWCWDVVFEPAQVQDVLAKHTG